MPDVFPDFIIPGLPGPLTPPTDRTVSSNTTLSQRLNYFRNLTITGSSTLTGVAGGTIIVVQQKLQIDSGSVLSVNALGAKGGAAGNNNPGFGAGPWSVSASPSGTPASIVSTSGFFSKATLDGIQPYGLPPIMQRYAADGGACTNGAIGSNGGAWPGANSGMPFDQIGFDPQDIWLWIACFDLMQVAVGKNLATYGSIGGGGGGSGGAVVTGSPGTLGGSGQATTAAGGSGIGGGGGGGEGGGASNTAGGRGGGVLLVFCSIFSGAGIVSADGGAGATGTSNSSGGGGGGGGAAAVLYHIADSSAPTVRANGGAGGGSAGVGKNGGSGGAGASASVRISTAIATTI